MSLQERYDVKEYSVDVHKCIRCGYCVVLCPVHDFMKWESESPRGRMQLIKGLIDEELKFNNLIMDRMFECNLCGYCKFKCPAKVRTVDAIKAARSRLNKDGYVPKPIVAISDAIKESKNIYNNAPNTRTDWIDYMAMKEFVNIGDRADAVYFTGCSTILTSRAMSIASATAAILNKLEYKWTLLGEEEWCCGNPFLAAGQIDNVEKFANHNIKAIKSTGAKTIITSCPGCYRVFVEEYPDIIGDFGLEVLHITQVIEKGIDDDKLKFNNRIARRVTYHDPCELGRYQGVFEPPRKILESIPGMKFSELSHTKNFTQCCGAGGLMKTTFQDLSKKMGIRKLKEANEVKAEVIVSSCQTCKLNIMDAIQENRAQLKTVDIAELVAKAIGAKEMESPRTRRFVNFL